MSEVRDEIESILIKCSWFDSAPFKWVGLIIRYGLACDAVPSFERINKRYGDLPISIEVNVKDIYQIHNDKKLLSNYFKQITLLSLIAVAERYSLPKAELENELAALQVT